jgi:predicted O-methyltransferase YrrM
MTQRIQKLLEYDRLYWKGAGSGDSEHLLLYGLIRMLRPASVLEIGVSRGHMTAWLALALADNGTGGSLVSVDNWSKVHGGNANGPQHAQRRLRDNGLLKRVQFVKSDSVEYLKKQGNLSFDFVWVDGDHSFEGARDDIAEALRVAKLMVAVHDTHQLYSGPRDAIRDILPSGSGAWIKGGRGIWMCHLT